MSSDLSRTVENLAVRYMLCMYVCLHMCMCVCVRVRVRVYSNSDDAQVGYIQERHYSLFHIANRG